MTETATPRQRWAIFCATGINVKEAELSKEDAHELLDDLNHEEEQTRLDAVELVALVPGAIEVRRRTPRGPEALKRRDPRKRKPPPRSPRSDPRKPVKLRKVGNSASRVITVPGAIAALLDDETEFRCFLTPDGLLFKPLLEESDHD